MQTVESIAYERRMNLKLAASDLGIKWQTLYSRLKKQGVNVVGDKLRYGTDRDKLAALAEGMFHQLVPFAKPMNEERFQAKFDFLVGEIAIDVKASRLSKRQSKSEAKSWAFSFKKQSYSCDFMCCFCFGDERNADQILLIPKEFFRGLQTITVSPGGKSKWSDYAVEAGELSQFFSDLAGMQAKGPA